MSILLGLAINLRNICEKVENTTRIAPLIVVPGYELHKVIVERDTSLGIEDRGADITIQISGDNIILSVSEYT